MVSLRERTKAELVQLLKSRTAKMPLLLDESDFVIQLERAIRVLNEHLYSPRSVILENAQNTNIDVTAFQIDEITSVYYATDSAETLLGGMDLGIGVLPLIQQGSFPTAAVGNLVDYFILKSVLNGIQRKLMNIDDYTLLPMTADGRQFLQVRNPGSLLWVEFLPYLRPDSSSWALYEHEYSFVLELAFAYTAHANVEMQAQASLLGVAKEAATLLNYWDAKVKDLIKAWDEASIITYIS